MTAESASARQSVDVTDLQELGAIKLVDRPGYAEIFLTRIRSGIAPPGAAPTSEPDEYIVAYARRCPHMGAYLVAQRHAETGSRSVAEEAVVRCPAHLSCFDLRHGGLMIIGQATARLAQVELERKNDESVILCRWKELPYGTSD